MNISTILFSLFLFVNVSRATAGLIFDQEERKNIQRLQELKSISGLKVLWWNLAWGQYNNNGDLDKNFQSLIKSHSAPEVISLSEYKPSIFKTETIELFKAEYPFQDYVPYHEKSDVGVILLSKYPFEASKKFSLKWTPAGFGKEEAEKYQKSWEDFDFNWVQHWSRTFSFYKLKMAGKNLFLSPVHLCSPWQSFQKKYGNWQTLRTLKKGFENPLSNQIYYLKNILRQYFGENLNQESLVLFGDFNVPSTIPVPVFGGTSKIFSDLQSSFKKALPKKEDTFPTQSTMNKQTGFFKDTSVQIDHVFFNDHVSNVKAMVIHLQGSDHYPIFMVIN